MERKFGFRQWIAVLVALACSAANVGGASQEANEQRAQAIQFAQLQEALNWKEVLIDSGKDDWRQHWFLDGEKATLQNTDEGLIFSAGNTEWEPASHAVLWTR